MAIVIPEGFSQIRLNFTSTTSTHNPACTFGINWPGSTNPVDDLRTAITDFVENIIQDCTTNIAISNFTFTSAAEGGGVGSGTLPLIAPKSGAIGGDQMTPQVAYLYRKQGNKVGRKHRGRLYIPGVAESKVDGAGVIDPDFVEDQTNHCETAMEALADAGSEAPFVMVLLHSDPDLDPTPVTDLFPEEVVATQRRRLVRT